MVTELFLTAIMIVIITMIIAIKCSPRRLPPQKGKSALSSLFLPLSILP